VKAAVCCNAGL